MRKRCSKGPSLNHKPLNKQLKDRKTLKCKRLSDRAKMFKGSKKLLKGKTKSASASSNSKKRSKFRPRWMNTDRKSLKRGRQRQLLEPKP